LAILFYFTIFGKIFRKMCRRKASTSSAAGKCNLACHLLSQRAEGIFGDGHIAPLCGEPFKSQLVIIGL
jgi:hypothetical protein